MDMILLNPIIATGIASLATPNQSLDSKDRTVV